MLILLLVILAIFPFTYIVIYSTNATQSASNTLLIYQDSDLEEHFPNGYDVKIRILSFDERVAYYLTNEWTSTNYMYIENSSSIPFNYVYDVPFLLSKNHMISYSPNLTFDGEIDIYVQETIAQMNNDSELEECSFLTILGDITLAIAPEKNDNQHSQFPVLMKARYIGKQNVILLKYTKPRHWNFWEVVDKYDVPFENKTSNVVWRGRNNDRDQTFRYDTVKKYFNHSAQFLDIAFGYYYDEDYEVEEEEIVVEYYKVGNIYNWFWIKPRIKQKRIETKIKIPSLPIIHPPLPEKIVKYSLSPYTVEQMLRSKYLATIPGNDVATNFGWILYSNSVPFAYHPFIKETWLMHGLLIPYVHYIPFNVNDDSLLEGYEFCESNPENCSQIALNGKHWMMQFMVEAIENKIQNEILKQYCNRVHFI